MRPGQTLSCLKDTMIRHCWVRVPSSRTFRRNEDYWIVGTTLCRDLSWVREGSGFWVFTLRSVSGCAVHLKSVVTSLSVSEASPLHPPSLFLVLSHFPVWRPEFSFRFFFKPSFQKLYFSHTHTLLFPLLFEPVSFLMFHIALPPLSFWYPLFCLPNCPFLFLYDLTW